MALWTPDDIATTLWLDASDTSTITYDANGLSLWQDKSGNDYHARQNTTANRPEYNSGAVTFQDGDRWIIFDDIYPTAQTFYVVFKPVDDSNYILFADYSEDTHWILNAYNGSSSTTVYNNAGNVVRSRLNAEDITFSTRGDAYTALNRKWSILEIKWLVLPSWDLTISGYHNTFGNVSPFTGDILEIVAVDDAPDDDTRAKIEGYLAWHNGLVDNLPADHAYKSYAPENGVRAEINVSEKPGSVVLSASNPQVAFVSIEEPLPELVYGSVNSAPLFAECNVRERHSDISFSVHTDISASISVKEKFGTLNFLMAHDYKIVEPKAEVFFTAINTPETILNIFDPQTNISFNILDRTLSRIALQEGLPRVRFVANKGLFALLEVKDPSAQLELNVISPSIAIINIIDPVYRVRWKIASLEDDYTILKYNSDRCG